MMAIAITRNTYPVACTMLGSYFQKITSPVFFEENDYYLVINDDLVADEYTEEISYAAHWYDGREFREMYQQTEPGDIRTSFVRVRYANNYDN